MTLTALIERAWRWRLGITLSAIGALAAVLRLINIAQPRALVFDELYYARAAYSLKHLGYEAQWSGDNALFAQGDFSGMTLFGDRFAHPPLGKIILAGGMQIAGDTSLGWRLSAALVGIATVVLLVLVARKLFGSLLWGGLAATFLAIDGQHIVHSRMALLDVFLTGFALFAFWLLLRDRDWARARLRQRLDALGDGPGADAVLRFGPGLGFRWWRFAAIVTLGLSAGIKWSGLYFAAFFLLMSVVWDAVDRRNAGIDQWATGWLVRAAAPAFALTATVIPAVYTATWWPWFASAPAYGRDWAATHPGEGVTWLPDALRSFVEYHRSIGEFHLGLDASHPYASNPLGWILQLRSTSYYYEQVPDAECGGDNCVSAITALGHPMLWLMGAVALLFVLWRAIVRRDGLALAVCSGTLAGWLPWVYFFYADDRTMFSFYTVSFAPWVMLTLVYVLREIGQPALRNDPSVRVWTRDGMAFVAGVTAAAFVVAAYFLPIWTGDAIPYQYWYNHMWLPTLEETKSWFGWV